MANDELDELLPNAAAQTEAEKALLEKFKSLTPDEVKKVRRRMRIRMGIGIAAGAVVMAAAVAVGATGVGLPLAGFIGTVGGVIIGSSVLGYRNSKTMRGIRLTEEFNRTKETTFPIIKPSLLSRLFSRFRKTPNPASTHQGIEMEVMAPDVEAVEETWFNNAIADIITKGENVPRLNALIAAADSLGMPLQQRNRFLTDALMKLESTRPYPSIAIALFADAIADKEFDLIKGTPARDPLLRVLVTGETDELIRAFQESTALDERQRDACMSLISRITLNGFPRLHAVLTSGEMGVPVPNVPEVLVMEHSVADSVMSSVSSDPSMEGAIHPSFPVDLEINPSDTFRSSQPVQSYPAEPPTVASSPASSVPTQQGTNPLMRIAREIMRNGESKEVLNEFYRLLQMSPPQSLKNCLEFMQEEAWKATFPKSIPLLQELLEQKESKEPAVLRKINNVNEYCDQAEKHFETLAADQDRVQSTLATIQRVLGSFIELEEELSKTSIPQDTQNPMMLNDLARRLVSLKQRLEAVAPTPTPSHRQD